MRGSGGASDVYWVDRPMPASADVSLDEALRDDRIEFWYQPKIELKLKKLVGVEAFARLRDRAGNVVPAGELMAGAAGDTVVRLTEQALMSALKTSVNLAEIGVDVQLAVNVNILALTRLRIAEIVRKHRPDGGRCTTLIFDVKEEHVLTHVDKLRTIAKKLHEGGFSIAIDDFGASLLSTMREKEACEHIDRTFAAIAELKAVSFSEMKLHRTLVHNCGKDELRRAVCKHIIDLAHSFGSRAVAVGVEKSSELRALQELGCDIGQGYLFGRPMTEEEFLMLLWERGVKARHRVA